MHDQGPRAPESALMRALTTLMTHKYTARSSWLYFVMGALAIVFILQKKARPRFSGPEAVPKWALLLKVYPDPGKPLVRGPLLNAKKWMRGPRSLNPQA